MLHDLFICHASEHKEAFVRPLAAKLRSENIDVWFDEFSLRLGDSIRRALDKGLRQSRFGLVVLSEAFFCKEWPQYELDGLAELEMKGRDKVILPIWHGVSHEDVLSHSPSLAGRRAVLSSAGLDRVVSEVCAVVHPSGSPLLIARDDLIARGLSPPVVTDQYWLHVVEASNRLPGYGAYIPEESTWGRWSFPLPPQNDSSECWGERLAWTAMQLDWVRVADERRISPLTRPEEVLSFIDSCIGLNETSKLYPDLLIEYAPQLAIPGFGGTLEKTLDDRYRSSLREQAAREDASSEFGSALTTTKASPLCEEEWSIRHPTFGNYKPRTVAHAYFSGGMFGPTVSPFEHFDHAVWLLSSLSDWLPRRIHRVLLEGLKNSSIWTWGYASSDKGGDWESVGALCEHLFNVVDGVAFVWTTRLEDDLRMRLTVCSETLCLPESLDELSQRFKREEFIEAFIRSEREIRHRRIQSEQAG